MLNIDLVAQFILLPSLKYPIILLLPFIKLVPRYLIYMLSIITIIINGFNKVNSIYERKAYQGKKWLSYDQLEEPVAIVTGGTNGLGKDIISRLLVLSQNIKIINIDIDDLTLTESNNSRVIFKRCDLSNIKEVETVTKELKTLYGNRICLIVNNAGMRSTYSNFNQISQMELSKVMQINCYTPFKLIQELGYLSPPNAGQCYVINIASTLGILSPARISSYAASKAALISLHNSFTFELKNREQINDIRTLLVITGQLNTQMFTGFVSPRQFFAPVVDSKYLAHRILSMSTEGKQTIIYEPFYAKFAYLLMSMPSSVQAIIRWFAQMDTCLPIENGPIDSTEEE